MPIPLWLIGLVALLAIILIDCYYPFWKTPNLLAKSLHRTTVQMYYSLGLFVICFGALQRISDTNITFDEFIAACLIMLVASAIINTVRFRREMKHSKLTEKSNVGD